VQSGLIHSLYWHGLSGLITERGTRFGELSMETQVYTQTIEPSVSLLEGTSMARAPGGQSLDAP
jgi:hypothetical protein